MNILDSKELLSEQLKEINTRGINVSRPTGTHVPGPLHTIFRSAQKEKIKYQSSIILNDAEMTKLLFHVAVLVLTIPFGFRQIPRCLN